MPSDPNASVLQSWDTASRGGPENDWSVCTTWVRIGALWYLVHVWRGRVNYPDLKAKVISLANEHGAATVLIELAGTALALHDELTPILRGVIGIKPTGDKESRMASASSVFEARQVYFPERAPWLADLERELFSFPGGTHDDQVDSISQAINYGKSDPGLIWANVGPGFERLKQDLELRRRQQWHWGWG